MCFYLHSYQLSSHILETIGVWIIFYESDYFISNLKHWAIACIDCQIIFSGTRVINTNMIAQLILGYSINSFTLLAMVLGIGMVVDDAIIAALQVLSAMIRQQSSLEALCARLHKYPQQMINIGRPHHFSIQAHATLKQLKTQALDHLGSTGRILIRESGTEPLMRVFLEAEDPILVEQAGETLVAEIKKIL